MFTNKTNKNFNNLMSILNRFFSFAKWDFENSKKPTNKQKNPLNFGFSNVIEIWEWQIKGPVDRHAQLLSRVQLFPSPWTVACQVPLVHGILQARILERVPISYARGSSWLRVWTCISCISCTGRRILYHWHQLGSPKDSELVFIF